MLAWREEAGAFRARSSLAVWLLYLHVLWNSIMITVNAIDSSSDDELQSLLFRELEQNVSAGHGSPEFLAKIRNLPVGLRAMAATWELDVSFALDDLGWHFGNWHSNELS